MPITLTCPSCGQQCAVKEEYAGMQVRCPRCPGVISVPAASAAAPVILEAEPVPTTPASDAAALPPVQRAPAGPTFLDNVTKFLAANGVSGVNFILLLVGLGCMALFLITILLPWTPSVSFALPKDFGGGGKFEVSGGSSLGIAHGSGLLYFFLTLGILFLVVFVILLGWRNLFEYSLWTASNWAIFVTLHLLLQIRYAAWGMIMSLVVMLAAAGTLGVVTFTRLFAAKPPPA